MRLYLDDDVVDKKLISLLRNAGHDVHVPPRSGQRDSVPDAEHLANAIEAGRALLTKNYLDFVPLAKLLAASGGRHHGLLIVREGPDPRDMAYPHTISAIANIGRFAE